MKLRGTLSAKGFVLVLVVVSTQLIIFGILAGLYIDLDKHCKHAWRDTKVMNTMSKMYLWAVDLMQLRIAMKVVQEKEKKKQEIMAHCASIKQLLTPEELRTFEILEFENEILNLYNFVKPDQTLDEFRSVAARTSRMWARTARLKELVKGRNDDIHESYLKQRASRDATLWALFLSIALQLVLIVFAIWYIRRDIATRLNVIMDNIKRFGKNEELRPLVGGRDEITDLDRSFHRMAEAVQFADSNKRNLVEHANDVICRINENRQFIMINNACESVFGYEPDSLISKQLDAIVPKEDHERLKEQLSKIREGQENFLETRVNKQDSTFAVDTLWSVRWSDDTKSYFCVVHDVTERKRADRLRQEVLQMVSHDLRSPLATVSSFLDMANEGHVGDLTAKGNEKVLSASFATVQMVELIDSLLDIEKIEAGMLELEKETVPLSEIFEETNRLVEFAAQDVNIELEFSETDLSVYADRDRLLQIVEKLVSDAVRCSPDGSKVMIDAQSIDDEFVEIKVIDQGKKVPDHLKDIVFDMFAQARLKEAKDYRGAGIGLAVCKSLVELHAGIIASEHQDGYNIFSFCLPCRSGLSMYSGIEQQYNTQRLTRQRLVPPWTRAENGEGDGDGDGDRDGAGDGDTLADEVADMFAEDEGGGKADKNESAPTSEV